MESIERADIRHQTRALFFECFPNRLVRDVRVFVRPGMVDASVFEPGIQLGIRSELRPRHEEPPPERTHLVLDLAFLPARSWGACHRLDQLVPAHLLKAAVVSAILADKDRVYRRLRVHCPRTNGGQFPLS